MKEAAVADSACLIGLERIGRSDILPTLFDPIFIPNEVDREYGIRHEWLSVEATTSVSLIALLQMVVDSGEAEAIALAHEKKCLLIVDDKQARAAAKRLGVCVIGTVGMLIRAKHHGLINEIKPILDDLDAQRFFISRALREEALKIVGE